MPNNTVACDATARVSGDPVFSDVELLTLLFVTLPLAVDDRHNVLTMSTTDDVTVGDKSS